jgi:flagellar hook-associated protein 2
MRTLLGSSSGASSVFTRLSDAGLEVQSNGSLSVSAGKLDTALANLPELKKLFANSDTLVPANEGIARQFRTMGDSLLSVDGAITTRTDGLRRRIELNQDAQERLDQRVAQIEKRLRAQYTALDATLGRMSGLSSYVTQQMAMFTNSTKA